MKRKSQDLVLCFIALSVGMAAGISPGARADQARTDCTLSTVDQILDKVCRDPQWEICLRKDHKPAGRAECICLSRAQALRGLP